MDTGCISIGRLLALGARGYKFKSCHPDALRIYDSEGISTWSEISKSTK